MKKTALVSIVILSLLFIGKVVHAQIVQILTAIPPRLQLEVEPGEFVRETVQFRNEGDSVLYLSAIAKDFIVQDTAGTPNFVDREVSGRWAASSWISVSPTSFSVAPGQMVDISLNITVPPDALPGGHYAGILYQATGKIPLIGGGVATGTGVNQIVGTLVYLTVEGPVTEQALVKQFTAPRFLEFGPVPFTTEILNRSDLHIRPTGTITVRNILGRVTTTMALEERNIFPGASFLYKNTWDAKYLLGRYRADLVAPYGATGQVLLATIYFIVFPLKIALAIVLAIAIIILATKLYRRRQLEAELEEELEEVKAEKEEAPEEKKK